MAINIVINFEVVNHKHTFILLWQDSEKILGSSKSWLAHECCLSGSRTHDKWSKMSSIISIREIDRWVSLMICIRSCSMDFPTCEQRCFVVWNVIHA